jgi:hypothetical protein
MCGPPAHKKKETRDTLVLPARDFVPCIPDV